MSRYTVVASGAPGNMPLADKEPSIVFSVEHFTDCLMVSAMPIALEMLTESTAEALARELESIAVALRHGWRGGSTILH